MFYFSILCGKIFSLVSERVGLGAGSTWPGHIALKMDPNFLKEILEKNKTKIVLVVGTNGKTTTSTMISAILKNDGKTVFQNTSGANLKNGVVSSFIAHASLSGKINSEYVVLEVDENNLAPILKDLAPKAVIILNLFRDQLDRYGELDSIATKWKAAFQNLTSQTNLILNADDPLIASLGQVGQNTNAPVYYFGLEEKSNNKILGHASDSIYCPLCKTKLAYTEIYYSHLGHFACPSCGFKRPQPDLSEISCGLPGTYNKYNALAAGLFALKENIDKNKIETALKNIGAVFGRQEKIQYQGKNIQIFLSKNPTSFNQSIGTIFSDLNSRTYNFLFVLNDDIPDGRDISWIWDIDIEEYMSRFSHVTISGDRTYDMALRFQYGQESYQPLPATTYDVEPTLAKAVEHALAKTSEGETLYILPTYSAMLQIRKILTGRKIL